MDGHGLCNEMSGIVLQFHHKIRFFLKNQRGFSMHRKKRNRDFDFSVSSDVSHNDISGVALEFRYAIGLFLKTKDGFRYTGKTGT